MTRNSFRNDFDLSTGQIGCGCLLSLLALAIPVGFWFFWGWIAVQLVHAIAK